MIRLIKSLIDKNVGASSSWFYLLRVVSKSSSDLRSQHMTSYPNQPNWEWAAKHAKSPAKIEKYEDEFFWSKTQRQTKLWEPVKTSCFARLFLVWSLLRINLQAKFWTLLDTFALHNNLKAFDHSKSKREPAKEIIVSLFWADLTKTHVALYH